MIAAWAGQGDRLAGNGIPGNVQLFTDLGYGKPLLPQFFQLVQSLVGPDRDIRHGSVLM